MLKISDKISAIALSAVLGVAAFNTQAGFNPNQQLLTNENAITESIIIKFKNNQILSNADITSVSGLELKPRQKMSTGAQVFQVQSKTMSMLKSQDANNAKKTIRRNVKKIKQ